VAQRRGVELATGEGLRFADLREERGAGYLKPDFLVAVAAADGE